MPVYSADYLRSLECRQAKIDPDTLVRCKDLGITRLTTYKKTKRGKRAGKNLRHKIPVVVSSERLSNSVSKKCKLPGRPPCLTKICTDYGKNHSFGRCHVACLNAQSVRTSTHDIRDLIVDEKLDILFLTETWLYSSGDESCVADFTPTGYTTKSFPRKGRKGGGIAIVSKKRNRCYYSS